jgi:hypothetical protein
MYVGNAITVATNSISGLTTIQASGTATVGGLQVNGNVVTTGTISCTGISVAGSGTIGALTATTSIGCNSISCGNGGISVTGALSGSTATFSGAISAATANASVKAFDIAHPDPSKAGMRLRHRCLEGEEHGTYYTTDVTCHEGLNQVDLPPYFQYLNTKSTVFASPLRHFGAAWGEVVGNSLQLTANGCGDFNVLILAVRQDPDAVKEQAEFGVEYTPQ